MSGPIPSNYDQWDMRMIGRASRRERVLYAPIIGPEVEVTLVGWRGSRRSTRARIVFDSGRAITVPTFTVRPVPS